MLPSEKKFASYLFFCLFGFSKVNDLRLYFGWFVQYYILYVKLVRQVLLQLCLYEVNTINLCPFKVVEETAYGKAQFVRAAHYVECQLLIIVLKYPTEKKDYNILS